MTPSVLAPTLDARNMKRLPTSTPDDTRPRRVEDARSPLHRDKWPGLTTAQSLAVASQFGVSLAVGVGLGLVAGQWLDGQVHTGFLFTLIGVFAGLILGMSSIVALYRATLRSSEREWREESPGRGPAADA
jgi:ATP synthase protein I